MSRSHNLGILAHVDAGKTSLTERLLYATGVVGDLGRVENGSTVTDSMDLERRRGITIKAAVASFELADVSVNLIDTPGHSDFIAEVERVLGVLDGAVLVISAVEGVQPQTRVLMRVLQRLRIPTLLFVSGYWPRQSAMHQGFDKAISSTAGDFRNLTPLVLMDALREAGTVVREPIHHFRAEVPADVFGTLLPVLTKLRAVPRESRVVGGTYVVEGEIPAGRVHELEQLLPPLTRGSGVLESAFDHFSDATGPPPERTRTDLNPLDRKEYLLRLSRRVG